MFSSPSFSVLSVSSVVNCFRFPPILALMDRTLQSLRDAATLAAAFATGGTDLAQRRALALKAFRHTAEYDSAIATYFTAQVEAAPLPQRVNLVLDQVQVCRYGENPHQQGG